MLYNNTEISNQLDVIFAGSSRIDSVVFPMQLWEDYGIASFNNAQSGQTLPVTYWVCSSVLKRIHPKLLVLDVSSLVLDDICYSVPWTHESIDVLPIRERMIAALALAKEEDKAELL